MKPIKHEVEGGWICYEYLRRFHFRYELTMHDPEQGFVIGRRYFEFLDQALTYAAANPRED
jgi:hypothetical protein